MNTLEEDITIDSPHIELKEIKNDSDDTSLMFLKSVVEDGTWLCKLHDKLRIDHLNSEEYMDVFHLPGDKLTFTTAAEHTILTPTIDPTRGINTKPYRIPEIHRDEV